ncbi:DUF2274 domain-containing protein [Caulobacter sp. LARHSG274]
MKLQRLPDRNPVRLTISVMPDLNGALVAYAEAYKSAYGEAASVTDLIPEMLKAYLASDREFTNGRKSGDKSGA